ncbi:MAG: flagellin, partial [Lentisphaerae bacterium]|nr:flagellin [Lentisphaerota bacterium]
PINLTNSNYAVIGSYGKWSYGSINMTALGSTFYRVKWASIICGARMSISIQTLAQAAVDKLNVASDFISGRRAVFGAMTNRLQQTLEGLRTYEENARAAESRIRDVDVAAESTQFSKYQVLTQMGTALLAQANALPNNVLMLLGR